MQTKKRVRIIALAMVISLIITIAIPLLARAEDNVGNTTESTTTEISTDELKSEDTEIPQASNSLYIRIANNMYAFMPNDEHMQWIPITFDGISVQVLSADKSKEITKPIPFKDFDYQSLGTDIGFDFDKNSKFIFRISNVPKIIGRIHKIDNINGICDIPISLSEWYPTEHDLQKDIRVGLNYDLLPGYYFICNDTESNAMQTDFKVIFDSGDTKIVPMVEGSAYAFMPLVTKEEGEYVSYMPNLDIDIFPSPTYLSSASGAYIFSFSMAYSNAQIASKERHATSSQPKAITTTVNAYLELPDDISVDLVSDIRIGCRIVQNGEVKSLATLTPKYSTANVTTDLPDGDYTIEVDAPTGFGVMMNTDKFTASGKDIDLTLTLVPEYTLEILRQELGADKDYNFSVLKKEYKGSGSIVFAVKPNTYYTINDLDDEVKHSVNIKVDDKTNKLILGDGRIIQDSKEMQFALTGTKGSNSGSGKGNTGAWAPKTFDNIGSTFIIVISLLIVITICGAGLIIRVKGNKSRKAQSEVK